MHNSYYHNRNHCGREVKLVIVFCKRVSNMKGEMTDFEKYLIERLDGLEEKVVKLRINSSLWGGLMGVVSSFLAYILKDRWGG